MRPHIKLISKKEKVREDSYFVNSDENIYITADGLSGTGGVIGSTLSANLLGLALESELRYHPEKYKTDKEIKKLMIESAISVNKKVSSLNGLSTVSCLLLRDNKAYTLNLGDSRIYQVNTDTNKVTKVKQLTKDQSLEQFMLDNSSNTEDKIEDYLMRNSNSGPTFYMGKELFTGISVKVSDEIVKRDYNFEEIVSVDVHHYETGDQFLVTTDGLTTRVTNNEIDEVIVDYIKDRLLTLPYKILDHFTKIIDEPKEMLEYLIRNAYELSDIKQFVSRYVSEDKVKDIEISVESNLQKVELSQLLINHLHSNSDLRTTLTEDLKYDDTAMIWIETDSVEDNLLNRLKVLDSSQEPLSEMIKEWETEINTLRENDEIYLANPDSIENIATLSIDDKIGSILSSLVDTNKAICELYVNIRENLELSPEETGDVYQFFNALGTKHFKLTEKITELEKKKILLISEKEKKELENKGIITKIEQLYDNIVSKAKPLSVNVDLLISKIQEMYDDTESNYQNEKLINAMNADIIREYNQLKNEIVKSSALNHLKAGSTNIGSVRSTLDELVLISGEDETEVIKNPDDSLLGAQFLKAAHDDYDKVSHIYSILPEELKRKLAKKNELAKTSTMKVIQPKKIK